MIEGIWTFDDPIESLAWERWMTAVSIQRRGVVVDFTRVGSLEGRIVYPTLEDRAEWDDVLRKDWHNVYAEYRTTGKESWGRHIPGPGSHAEWAAADVGSAIRSHSPDAGEQGPSGPGGPAGAGVASGVGAVVGSGRFGEADFRSAIRRREVQLTEITRELNHARKSLDDVVTLLSEALAILKGREGVK